MTEELKRSKSTIIRLVAIQLGSTFLGLILAFATIKNDLVHLCASIFCILFYAVIAYTVSNEWGLADQIKIEGGRLPLSYTRGILIGVCANIVNFIVGIGAIVGKLCISNLPFFSGNKEIVADPAWAGNVYQIFGIISEILQSMYLGFNNRFLAGNGLTFILAPLFSCAVIYAGYTLGQHGWAGLFTGEAKKKNK